MVRDARYRGLLTMRVKDFPAKPVLILRSPLKAGVSKDGRERALRQALSKSDTLAAREGWGRGELCLCWPQRPKRLASISFKICRLIFLFVSTPSCHQKPSAFIFSAARTKRSATSVKSAPV
ncbi:hypothetical protein FBZ96_105205 [Bradyrhizobium stylosanthis]|uniref:Uncharacterized protein n=1 Tax=Bradyrhizobium stylosanthis TaxID=1803665 RepID=A0A560DN39_9BRAD|nr:hypothetical protein FBZ96_105205 [Bradyrhizobium stylosanthis]